MRGFLILLLFCIVNNSSLFAGYIPDILKGYEQRTLVMEQDYEGEVVCTIVRKPLLQEVDKAVLYIHGYNDYFFQAELGDSIQSYGYNFYALDLRKYGRSILPHQKACYCKNLNEYYTDIDAALDILKAEGQKEVILMGHSTGGLISSLYANERQEKKEIKSLILNSPFLDMNMSWFMEKIAIPVVAFFGKYFPDWVIEEKGFTSYAQSLLSNNKGEWNFNTSWKRPEGYPKRAGWLRAIHLGHKQIKKGLSINIPVLVVSSDKSYPESEDWHDEYRTSDIVLDVKDIQGLAPKLGQYVTRDTIPNGMHDLILSASPYRNLMYQVMNSWIKESGN